MSLICKTQWFDWNYMSHFSTLDITSILGYPNALDWKVKTNIPIFDGDPSSKIDQKAEFIKHASKIHVAYQDVLIELFIISITYKHRDWLDSCEPRSIPSFTVLIGRFLEVYGAILVVEIFFPNHLSPAAACNVSLGALGTIICLWKLLSENSWAWSLISPCSGYNKGSKGVSWILLFPLHPRLHFMIHGHLIFPPPTLVIGRTGIIMIIMLLYFIPWFSIGARGMMLI